MLDLILTCDGFAGKTLHGVSNPPLWLGVHGVSNPPLRLGVHGVSKLALREGASLSAMIFRSAVR